MVDIPVHYEDRLVAMISADAQAKAVLPDDYDVARMNALFATRRSRDT